MQMFFLLRRFAVLLPLVLFTTVCALAQTGLKDIADDKGLFIGNIISNGLVENPGTFEGGNADYNLRTEYNTVVLENAMKMGDVLPGNEPQNIHNISSNQLRNTLQTTDINTFLNRPLWNSFRKRGHAMIWFNQAPDWLNENAGGLRKIFDGNGNAVGWENNPNNSGWSAEQVFNFSRKYIIALSDVCGNKIDEWDVINEAIADDAPNNQRRWRPNTWYKNANDGSQTSWGEASYENYIRMLFVWAREEQPNARLFYNDYAIENFATSSDSKNNFMREKFKAIKDCGGPIDGIGFQSHFVAADVVSSQGVVNTGFINSVKASMEDLADADLQVAITELDIRICNGDRDESTQEAAFYEIVKMAFEQPNCNEVLLWGQRDETSWITLANYVPFNGCQDPLIFEQSGSNLFSKKAAYNGVQGAIQSRPNGNVSFPHGLAAGSGTQPSCGGNGGGQAPYEGRVHNIPDQIQAEYYDTGGQGEAYNDSAPGNNGGALRNDGVDIQTTGDAGGGYNVGWTANGEWLEYTLGNVTPGTYDIVVRAATPNGGSRLVNFFLGNQNFGDVAITNTGGWQNWQTFVKQVTINSTNDRVLRMSIIGGGVNINWFEFLPVSSNQVIANGTYFIRAPGNNGQNLIAPSWAGHNARMIARGTQNGHKWDVTHLGNDIYHIKNVGTNRFLEVPYAECANGENVATYTAGTGAHQKWKIEQIGAIYFLRPSHCTAQAADRAGGGNNANVQTYSYWSGNNNQQWAFAATTKSFAGGSVGKPVKEQQFDVFPNPGDLKAMTISYTVPVETTAKLTLYDARGALMGSLIADLDAGQGNVRLAALTANNPLSTGMYVVRIEAGGHVETHRVVLRP